ncbi:MAG: NAD-dependent epimerase [Gammaproteobacteria bacterium]|nr:NAD-dependent epimerase [Gammaproteobacteria bacterium]
MKILVTGCAGFIGMHTAMQLLTQGIHVVGIDNLNDYYDPSLKEDRLKHLLSNEHFKFYQGDIADRHLVMEVFQQEKPERIIHLAAQAGVRYSLENPYAYIDSNIQGFINILEGCRQNVVEHLVYASSSSVYGANTKLPFHESHSTAHPVSLYAATKKANELMAHTYSHLYQIPTTGLRFFTVYGPWGRPDMAFFKFTRAMLSGETIEIYNHGEMVRDFTYIDDIVEGIIQVANQPPVPHPEFDTMNPDPAISNCPYRIFNIGNNSSVQLMDYISALETTLGVNAKKRFLPMQKGDVTATMANVDALYEHTGFKPQTSIVTGITKFVDWYRSYYHL